MTTIERIAFLTRIQRELTNYIQLAEANDRKIKEVNYYGGESSVIKTIQACVLDLQLRLTK